LPRKGLHWALTHLRIKRQAGNLTRFIPEDGDFSAVREELGKRRDRPRGAPGEMAQIELAGAAEPPRVDPAWVLDRLKRLEELIQRDQARPRIGAAR
jgi:hypothetical protein